MTPTIEPAQLSPAQRYLAHLRKIERRPLADLVFHQARLLESLVRHAVSYVPFYADSLSVVFDKDNILDLSRWHDVPLLCHDVAEANREALKATQLPASAGNAVADRTTGSGGSPFHFIRSTSALAADSGNSLRIFIDHGLDLDARFADIRLDISGTAQFPEGQTRKDWTHGEGSGDYVLLDISTEIEKQVEWLLRRNPRILFTWAGNARRIALALENMGRDLPLTSLATSAELCTPSVRADCQRVFGCDPIDILGARELGILAFPCHAAPVYHLAAESAFLEVITDEGRPAKPGESGQLVGTGLYNFHMPFIRYTTGDYVTLAQGSCACGRSLPAITSIHGRGRNRFARRDGARVFPDIPEALLDETAGPMAWQLVQTGPGELELRVENGIMANATAQTPMLTDALTRNFGENIRLTPVSCQRRPEAIRRKRERFISQQN